MSVAILGLHSQFLLLPYLCPSSLRSGLLTQRQPEEKIDCKYLNFVYEELTRGSKTCCFLQLYLTQNYVSLFDVELNLHQLRCSLPDSFFQVLILLATWHDSRFLIVASKQNELWSPSPYATMTNADMNNS